MNVSVRMSVQLIMFLWKIDVVDSFTAIQFIINGGAKYGGSVTVNY